MANILILTHTFPPDGVSTAHLYGDLAEDLVDSGHSVTVLSTRPHYNRDLAAERSQPISPLFGRILGISEFKGATVYHAFALQKSPSRPKRILSWLIFHAISTLVGWGLRRRASLILTPSPPLTIGVAAWLISLKHRAPIVYTVQELYPDIAIELGLIKSRPGIRASYLLERFVYRKSALITAITEGMRKAIVAKGVPDEKVRHIPNWVDTRLFQPVSKGNPFSIEHSLADKFVVSYAGNMGLAQSFDELIEAAQLLDGVEDLCFLLVGGGIERERLRRAASEHRNLLVLPHQPYELMPQIYGCTDLSYVPLLSDLGTTAMPSKVYKTMASGRAVLALTAPDSDLGRLVEVAECGYVVEPGSPQELSAAVMDGYTNRRETERMGLRGRMYVESRYSRESVLDAYQKVIAQYAASPDASV